MKPGYNSPNWRGKKIRQSDALPQLKVNLIVAFKDDAPES